MVAIFGDRLAREREAGVSQGGKWVMKGGKWLEKQDTLLSTGTFLNMCIAAKIVWKTRFNLLRRKVEEK